ncbi:MAG: ABC transporter ATP-binding protein [Desulfovibrio sp.]|jgi:branched-chain amino acid transport system ATP-binding protein|nr:ABC transporter ATP-binding protein [Desulfovibrio sp.]
MLELNRINTFYGKIQALRDVSLKVEDGEIVTLIGANGAGKSTTLMSICGVIHPRSGEILFDGKPIQQLPAPEIVKRGISQVPEGRLIFPELTVRENLDLGAFLRTDKKGIADDMEYVFQLFPILRERVSQTGGTLSGGEQQMLALGRALMARPRLLLLDEPSLGLAPIIIQQIFKIIQKVNEDGTTVFLVEQNANQALHIANRGYVMENGVVVMEGKAQELLSSEKVRKAYLGM